MWLLKQFTSTVYLMSARRTHTIEKLFFEPIQGAISIITYDSVNSAIDIEYELMNLVIIVAACCSQCGQFTSAVTVLLIRCSFANYPRPRFHVRFNYSTMVSKIL